MTLWRLEWLRLARTRRWLALVGVYLFFGLLGPPSVRYASQIMKRFAAGGIEIKFPTAIPADGVATYLKNASQIGLVVSVVIAAGALALDAQPAVSVFFRTRARSLAGIVLPRFVVTSLAVIAAFVIGAGAAWYETALLIGALPVGTMLEGTVLGALYLVFAVAVVALSASFARSVVGTIGVAVAALLALPIMGLVRGIGPWMPSELVGALDSLLRGGSLADFTRGVLVTLAAIPAALLWAFRRLEHREL